MKISRTRRHFMRTVILLHKYDKKSLKWSNQDKITAIEFCRKHRYSNFLNPKYKTNVLTSFFDTRSIYERYLRFLLNLKKSKLIETVENNLKEKYGKFSKDGYHYAIHGYYNIKSYDKVLDTFNDLLSDNEISTFSLSLWNTAARAMINTKRFDELDEIVEKVKRPFLYHDSITALQAICYIANEQPENAVKLSSSKKVRSHVTRILNNWEDDKAINAAELLEQYNLALQ